MAYAQQLQQPAAAPPLVSGSRHSDTPSCRRRPTALLCPTALQSTCNSQSTASSVPRPGVRACWAKKLVGKTKHNDPIVNQAMELSNNPLSSQVSKSTDQLDRESKAMNRRPNNIPTSGNFSLDLWSPIGGSSSSEENNSPTDLNSCKKIKDKPPLTKNLEVVQEGATADDSYLKEMYRPPSGGYINEEPTWDETSYLRVSGYNGGNKMEASGYTPRKVGKYPMNHFSVSPNDDENFLEYPCELSCKRSSRSVCDQCTQSSMYLLNERGNVINCCKGKRTSHSGSTSSNNSVTPPPPPERHDSLTTAVSEEIELRIAPWFQAGIPREIALEILGHEPLGSFMVRESTSKPGCFALSLRVPRDFHQSGIAHYLIMRTNRGYKIKGFTKEFGTLTALITHHSVMPELLPCPLSLARFNPNFKKHDSGDMVDINEDPDYNKLSDFRKMLSDINTDLNT